MIAVNIISACLLLWLGLSLLFCVMAALFSIMECAGSWCRRKATAYECDGKPIKAFFIRHFLGVIPISLVVALVIVTVLALIIALSFVAV